jgi:hypothetical protein
MEEMKENLIPELNKLKEIELKRLEAFSVLPDYFQGRIDECNYSFNLCIDLIKEFLRE